MMYSGEKLREISFPLGGIGTGSIGLAGNGALIDWEILNRPNKGSLNGYSFFAVKAEYPDGRRIVKILQGDLTKDLSGQYSKAMFRGFGYGPSSATMCSYPHFRKVRFDGKFPIATLTFEDEDFPARVVLKAFNPFIPLNADDSSIPAAFFEVSFKNSEERVKYSVILSVTNPFEKSVNERVLKDSCTAVKLSCSGKTSDDLEYGDLTVAVDRKDGMCQTYWYRGGWQDGVSTFWYDLTNDAFQDRQYAEAGAGDVCSVGASETLESRQSGRFRFLITWNVPNTCNYLEPYADENGKNITWKNYYASLFADSVETCAYSFAHWDAFYRKTSRFGKSLHSATLDRAVIDAVSSTISVLKSPTVLRLEDGTFYGWEGVHEQAGSCEGTCTHVWSYAYALCFLFPELERSMRDTELHIDTDEDGWMQFRTKLPIGRPRGTFHPCVDGQMATLIKVYRDWKLTGNSEWLCENWDDLKKILEFAWSENNTYEWDRDKDGVLEGRQHHTLDMELFGPSSWLEGMYLAALKAAAEMADFLGDSAKKQEYSELFEKGYAWTKANLFNGKYFFQKVNLEDQELVRHFDCLHYWNSEKGQLKYQIGEGCAIDQMLGQWHANICGLGDVFDPEQRRIALQNMWKNNWKPSLRNFANMWRVFALNDEKGTVICDYPEGSERPVISIPYSEECMTGFEYAFAGLLISEGFVEEGVEVVRAIRDRYDGAKRNPWNEIECGSNYARPMASFALLPIFSGFTFDMPNGRIGFSPVVSGDFRCFWSVGTGWGDFVRTETAYTLLLADGHVELKSIELGDVPCVKRVYADGKPVDFTQTCGVISFENICVRKELRIEL